MAYGCDRIITRVLQRGRAARCVWLCASSAPASSPVGSTCRRDRQIRPRSISAALSVPRLLTPGLVLNQIAVDGSITKVPGAGEAAGRSPVDRGKQGMKRSGVTDGYGIPLGRVLAGANRHDSPLLAPTLDLLAGLGPLPDDMTVHLDAGYDSTTSRALLDQRGLRSQIASKGIRAPIQAGRGWHIALLHA